MVAASGKRVVIIADLWKNRVKCLNLCVIDYSDNIFFNNPVF